MTSFDSSFRFLFTACVMDVSMLKVQNRFWKECGFANSTEDDCWIYHLLVCQMYSFCKYVYIFAVFVQHYSGNHSF